MRKILFVFLLFQHLFLHAEGVIHSRGYWQGIDILHEHKFDAKLAQALVHFFQQERAQTIVDFGCGMGHYVNKLMSAHFQCEGYDGNPNTYELSNGIASVLDLSQPFDLEKQYDWILCLEVGEHLPACYETILLENLDRHNSQGIVLSWALPGQGGFGHFNEQNNEYVKIRMKKLGYINDEFAETFLRMNSSLPWFRNTIMVFRKNEKSFL